MLYDGVEFVVFDVLLCDDIFSAELIVTRDYDDDDVAVYRSHCRRRRRCCYVFKI